MAAPAESLPSAESVAVAEVQLVRRPRYETAVGTIKPVHEASVASKLLARVVEVTVKAGQAVAKDEVLVRLDDSDLKAREQQAQAALDAAEARLKQAMADFERAEKLIAQNAIARADYDKAEAALSTANADLERARQALSESQVVLGYATIVAPLGGIVIDKRVEAGDTVSPGQILLVLYDPTHMQMVATVRESLALGLKVGDQLPARLESLGYECEATISEIVPEAEAASRSFTIKVTGPCPPGVYSGMFGRLLIPLAEEELVVVPRAAVHHVGQLTMVDVVSDGRLHRRSVQLGREVDSGYEVLAGLVPGERVALAPGSSSKEPQ
jgi:RND family efflux transporter MFP subunit